MTHSERHPGLPHNVPDDIRVLRYDRGWYYVSKYRFHRRNRLQVGPFATMEKALEAREAEKPPTERVQEVSR